MRSCSQMPYHMGLQLKIYPSDKQKHLIALNDGAMRSVYNHLVACSNERYRLSKTADVIMQDACRIDYLNSVTQTAKGIKNALPYLYEKGIDGQVVYNAMKCYQTAWKNMKERHTGVPTFHRKGYEKSYQTNGHYKAGDTGLLDGSVRFLDKRHIILPILGRIRFGASKKMIGRLLSHPENTRIGTITIKKDAVGEYFVSLAISSENPFRDPLPKTKKQVGIDLNLLDLANDSKGNRYENKRFRKASETKLIKAQRCLSRRSVYAKAEHRSLYHSRNYQKKRKRVAALHRKIARKRKDYLNRLSYDLVKSHDYIAAEDLQVRNLLKNHKLAKAISDASWRMLLTMLKQKAKMYDKQFVLVPPQYTTQTCSNCGYVMRGKERLPLSVRKWQCPSCGRIHQRDTNAAKNILNKALGLCAMR